MNSKSLPSDFLFGAAYYDEYMPYDRIETDFKLMKDAGMNVIRIAESTWSTWEPEDGRFDFTHLRRMLDNAVKYDLKVIVGTPTYAVPSWLVKKYPDIMAVTKDGQFLYGHRQLTDITNPDYLRYAERMIRRLMEECAGYENIIGFQLDNETRAAGAASPETQKIFVERLKKKYPDINEFNREFGLDYWSNRVDNWEDFPDIRGTINGSLSAAYKRFLRDVITEFLLWQRSILLEYMRPDQFITHNFDFAWDGYSCGVQPLVDQINAAEAVDIAGADIYHPTGGKLDGTVISFGGMIARSLKKDRYFVLETQAQGNTAWLSYPGQLRLHAYSHLASGAASVMYWNWHSIHNAIESYWKGVLSHDLTPGETYREISEWRHEMLPLEKTITGNAGKFDTAILVDSASLAGIEEFPAGSDVTYNDVFRWMHDTLFKMNIECDIVYKDDDWSSYKMLLIPALYSASDAVIEKIRKYAEMGGQVVLGFRSCFSDDEIKIYPDAQPHGMTEAAGMTYDRFTIPEEGMAIRFCEDGEIRSGLHAHNISKKEDAPEEKPICTYPVRGWMELLRPTNAEVIAVYYHKYWGNVPAVTYSDYGNGGVTYIGCYTDEAALRRIIEKAAGRARINVPVYSFPLIRKTVINAAGDKVKYFFNYSTEPVSFKYDGNGGEILVFDECIALEEREQPVETDRFAEETDDLSSDRKLRISGTGINTYEKMVAQNQMITLKDWGVLIVKEG